MKYWNAWVPDRKRVERFSGECNGNRSIVVVVVEVGVKKKRGKRVGRRRRRRRR